VTSGSVSALALVLAFGIDQLFGEPPLALHPVSWMGSFLNLSGAPWPTRRPATAFLSGAACWMAGAALCGGLAALAVMALPYIAQGASAAGPLVPVLGLAILLKPMLSWRMLCREVSAVETALSHEGLDAGRTRLQHLVSRNTAQLTETEIRESALESLAENLNDSLVAPVFWFVLGGLPAAAVYRFANTADAMWGYRGRFEWAGKWAARADDVLSFVPARLTALLLAIATPGLPRGVPRVAAATPSPNGGWPMGTLALLLGVRLSKPGVYVLNPGGTSVGAMEFSSGLSICARTAWLCVALGVGALAVVASGFFR
jgi:adenosylcobinamide-phosphate synthase